MAKLLIVDDEVSIREVFRLRFEKAGHEVSEARDGEEALTIAQESLPDLILLDIMMPKVDGLEVCFKLKNNPRTKLIPIVMMTAYDRDIEKLHRGRETAPAEAYFSKSWATDELVKMVDTLLRSE